MRFRALALAAAFLVAATATAADWPGFRGPNRDAVSTETGLLKQWPKEGPPKAWTAKNSSTQVTAATRMIAAPRSVFM